MKNKVMKQASMAALVLAGFMVSAPVAAEETSVAPDQETVQVESSTSTSETASSSTEASSTEASATDEAKSTASVAVSQEDSFKPQGVTIGSMLYDYQNYRAVLAWDENNVNTVVIIDLGTGKEVARTNEQFGYKKPVSGIDMVAQERGVAAAKAWVVAKVAELEQNTESSTSSEKTPTNSSQHPESEQDKESIDNKTIETVQPTAEEKALYKEQLEKAQEGSVRFVDLNGDGQNELVTSNGIYYIQNGKVVELGSIHAVGGSRGSAIIFGNYVIQLGWGSGSGNGGAEIRQLRADGSGYDVIARTSFDSIFEFNPTAWAESVLGKTEDVNGQTPVASTQQSSQQASVAKSAKATSSDTKKLPNTGIESSFLASVVGVITIMLGAIVASFSLKNKKN